MVTFLRRMWAWLTGSIRVEDLPVGQWTPLDDQTRVKRHADDSVEFETRLDDEHPAGTIRWK